jgi:hypothetical protein
LVCFGPLDLAHCNCALQAARLEAMRILKYVVLLGYVLDQLGKTQGALKKKSVGTMVHLFYDCLRFSGLILENMFMVFLGSSCRETAKNAIKNSKGKDDRKKVFFLSTFSAKSFGHGFPPKKMLWCF